MSDRVRRHMFEVIGYGLDVKQRLERGERPAVEAEMTKLRGLLAGDSELRNVSDYAGDARDTRTTLNPDDMRRTFAGARGSEPFRGVRYALACWLDELFIVDSPWSREWIKYPMEPSIYGGTQERGWRFWHQAKMAEARAGTVALEAYLWCVLLGFRGEPAEVPVDRAVPEERRISAWVEGVRARVLTGRPQKEFTLPPERDPPASVPRLRGRAQFETMLRVAAVVGLIAVLLAGIVLPQLL